MLADKTARTHETFVLNHFQVRGHSGDEYDVLCPIHGDRNASMRINVAKGVWFCHGCHEGGGMQKLAKLLGVRYTWDRNEEALSNLTRKLDAWRETQGTQPAPRVLDESVLEQYRTFPTDYWSAVCGFDQATIDLFDLGFDFMADVAIIPVRDIHGRLLGVTRRFLGESSVKYKDPKGFDKRHNLFGSWLAAEHPSSMAVICEGPKDAMKVWQAGYCGLGQYGTYITAEQIRILRRMGFTSVVLFYDNDEGGNRSFKGAKGFTEKADGSHRYNPETDMRRHFFVRRVSYRGSKAKDPGAMSVEEIQYRVAKARYLLS